MNKSIKVILIIAVCFLFVAACYALWQLIGEDVGSIIQSRIEMRMI